jgi:5'-phosphate synthase pdxT subunit
MKIGVLALQGAFREHIAALKKLDAETVEVRLPAHLESLDGLIIPGGESTTIGKLLLAFDLMEPIRAFGRQKAIWGTCAGAILLAKNVGRAQPLLELMNIEIERNAFGRQVESFEIDLDCPFLTPSEPPYHATFIRAPIIKTLSAPAQALMQLEDGRIVAARQENLLATSFHPELTDDLRFHRYFLEIAQRTRAA